MKKNLPPAHSIEIAVQFTDQKAEQKTIRFQSKQKDAVKKQSNREHQKQQTQDYFNYLPLKRPTIFDDFTIV